MLNGKHIILGITGGIAAYKSAELARLLVKQNARVSAVMTTGAQQFITPLTLETLTGQPVHHALWHNHPGQTSNIAHINLTREADALLIAPCTANMMAKINHGIADDLLSNLALARQPHQCPLAIAPAMNTQMWLNPATQRNLKQLQQDGVHLFGPDDGAQACGEMGPGRMLEPQDLVSAMMRVFTPQTMRHLKVMISAGPTFEAIDPVRGITNHSSGKMGYALAHAAWCAGASVTLISGKTALTAPYGVQRIDVQSAQDMLEACTQQAPTHDLFIAVAAVADWRVRDIAEHKIKKTPAQPAPVLNFEQTPDILAHIAQMDSAPYCVGFAAESEHIIEYAQSKRIQKNIPLIIANHGPKTFGSEFNQASIISAEGVEHLPELHKAELAHQLISTIARHAHITQPRSLL
jgi:phosphopantothenoylcysteine decarboxylase / phosphopantothenate---cysteine ligase